MNANMNARGSPGLRALTRAHSGQPPRALLRSAAPFSGGEDPAPPHQRPPPACRSSSGEPPPLLRSFAASASRSRPLHMLVKDESSGSSPDDPGDPRRSGRRIAWTCGASSVRLSRGIAGCRSRRTRSLPGRLPVSEPSRRTNSEPRASSAFPARLMDRRSLEDKQILMILKAHKLAAEDSSSWCADDEVQRFILHIVQKFVKDIDATKLKQRVDEFELMVKKHLEGTVQLVANKELLLHLFSYVEPDFVVDTQRTSPSPPRGQKRSSSYADEKDGSAIQHGSKRSSCWKGHINMGLCTHKLERCDLPDEQLWAAIDMLKADLELRQVFFSLGDNKAKRYILHVLGDRHG